MILKKLYASPLLLLLLLLLLFLLYTVETRWYKINWNRVTDTGERNQFVVLLVPVVFRRDASKMLVVLLLCPSCKSSATSTVRHVELRGSIQLSNISC